MSRRRRRGGNSNNSSNSNSSNHSGGSGKRQQPQKSGGAAQAQAADAFWGEASDEAAAVQRIRPTPEPAALPRSLGDPPLTPDTAAAHHVAVVYEEAVRAATALAAANSLLDTDALDQLV